MRFNGDCDTVFLPNILKTIVSNYSSKAGITLKHPQYVVEKHVKGVCSLLNIHPLVLPEHCRNAENVCCFTRVRSTCRFSNSSPDISYGTKCENMVIQTHNCPLLLLIFGLCIGSHPLSRKCHFRVHSDSNLGHRLCCKVGAFFRVLGGKSYQGLKQTQHQALCDVQTIHRYFLN